MLLLFHERGNPFSRGWYKWGTLEEEGTGGVEEGTGVSVELREERGAFAELRTSMGFGRLWAMSMAD